MAKAWGLSHDSGSGGAHTKAEVARPTSTALTRGKLPHFVNPIPPDHGHYNLHFQVINIHCFLLPVLEGVASVRSPPVFGAGVNVWHLSRGLSKKGEHTVGDQGRVSNPVGGFRATCGGGARGQGALE